MVGYQDITPYPVGGIERDEVAVMCTCKGYIPWYSTEGILHLVECLYSAQSDGTLISPTCIVQSYSEKYQGFVIETNCDDGSVIFKLLHRDGVSHATYPMHKSNGLWFHTYTPVSQPPTVKRLNDSCLSALWHGRLGCAGNNVMDTIHKHVIGIKRPLRRNPFYSCASCIPNKMSKRAIRTNKHIKTKNRKCPPEDHNLNAIEDAIQGESAQHFHMDFGFVIELRRNTAQPLRALTALIRTSLLWTVSLGIYGYF